MNYESKQKELDELKWNQSAEMGKDLCGSFDYCAACDMTQENPCAKAYEKANSKSQAKAEAAATTDAKPKATVSAEAKAKTTKKPAAKK